MIVLQLLLPMIGIMWVIWFFGYMMGYRKGRRDQTAIVEEYYRDDFK